MSQFEKFNKLSRVFIVLYVIVVCSLVLNDLNPHVNLCIILVSFILTILGVGWSENRKKVG